MSQHFHLEAGFFGIDRFYGKFLCFNNLDLIVIWNFLFFFNEILREGQGRLLFVNEFLPISADLAFNDLLYQIDGDTYISVLDSSARMVFPFTGIVTSIF